MFFSAISRGGALLTNRSQGCMDLTTPNLVEIGRWSLLIEFVSELKYLTAFLNAGGVMLIDVENNFCTFYSLW